MQDAHDAQPSLWRTQPYHRAWLTARAAGLFTSFAVAFNPRGGFFDLGDDGQPLRDGGGDCVRGLHATTRMVYCYALAHRLGHPGASRTIDHGMDYLWQGHRDPVHGGYFWQMRDAGPVDTSKQAYGHAFVLLAGAAAKQVGHPDADRLIDDVMTILHDRFWEAQHGATAEEFTADWQPLGAPYRGQNSNMHLTEALMAAYEATGDARCLAMAEAIADLLIRRITAANSWRLPEHFSADWQIDRDYAGSEMFRPAGTTPGHWLEWSRLLVQLWIAGGRKHSWMPDAAARMFRLAVQEGWDHERGGFFYTLDWNGQPLVADKIWWPLCEGIGAAVFLSSVEDPTFYENWYRRIWDFIGTTILDQADERWVPQLNWANQAKTELFTGRPDIYHALQACLIPLFPANGSLLAELARG
ncbi:AGE family epimerase/isomerase [Lichenifustis flavocetrariae]|uniref:AGE family epimerase/isomerase n=1 Tax=Lichenifustis flavocetrariae TaxID=2949735 RepID=A0AA41YTJ7_9HYPH|nr:AGE family epimerase/isomerase [Lichenifustis flavocetrariae]MCW6506568.1 AGE family epimerase/isomerase [Lichenifustis flavocetrariae]